MLLSRSRLRSVSAAMFAPCVLPWGREPGRTPAADGRDHEHGGSVHIHPATVATASLPWLLVEDLPDGVTALDGRGRIVLVNRQAAQLFGYEQGELLGRPIEMLMPKPWPVALVVSGGEEVNRDSPVPMVRHAAMGRRKDGTAIPVEVARRAAGHGSAPVVMTVRERRREPEEEARARLAAIVDASEDAISSETLDGTILSWNGAAERLDGYAAGEAIGRSVAMLVPPERSGEMEVILARLAAGEQVTQDATSRIRKDGREVWVSLSAAATRDPGGRIVGASEIARDVTANRRAEALLRESEERLRAVVESAAEGIVLQDASGRVLLTNPSADRILGRGPDGERGAIVTGGCWRAIREDGTPLPCHEQPVAVTLRSGEALSNVVIGLPVLDGGTRWLSVNTVPVQRHGESEPYAVIVSFFDITDVKRTEETLIRQYDEIERRRAQKAAILDAAQEAMVLVAPDGRLATANRRFADLLGLEPAAVPGCPLSALGEAIRRRFGDDGLLALMGAPASGDDPTATRPVRQIWPEPRDFDVTCAPVRGIDGAELGRLYSFLDVTREREVDRLKSDFVATVSHELRAPLTAISGFVDIMVDGMVGELPPRVRHYLGVVQANNRRLAGIIDDLLDMSRIEAGRAELRRSECDLATTIGAVATTMGPQLAAARLRRSRSTCRRDCPRSGPIRPGLPRS